MTEPADHARWLGALVARYEGPLISYARRVLGNGGGGSARGMADADLTAARDVVQETFLRLCRQPAADVAGHEAAWLYTVCRRVALDVRRKEKRMTLMNDDAADLLAGPAVDPAAAAERSDAAAEVHRLLHRLPENQREAILLKFGHGLSYKEIADVTGHSVSNVGVLIHLGLKAVRTQVGVA